MAISSYYSSPMRLSGLNSGMDTDSIVKSLVKLEQMKIDKVQQNKTSAQWKVDAYNGVNKKLTDFRSKYLSVLSPDNIFSASIYKASKADYKENNYFKVGTGSGALPGNYKITETKLAKYATIQGTTNAAAKAAEVSSSANASRILTEISGNEMTDTATGTTANGTAKLMNLQDSTSANVFQFLSNKVSFKINSRSFEFNDTDTLDDVVSAINTHKAEVGIDSVAIVSGKLEIKSERGKTVTLSNVIGKAFDTGMGISEGKQAQTMFSKTSTLAQFETITGTSILDSGQLEFKINGRSAGLSFNSSNTIQDVLDAVNSDPANKATMHFDEATMKFIVRGNSGEDAGTLKLENVAGKGKMFGADGLTGIAEGETKTFSYVNGNTKIADLGYKLGSPTQFDSDGKFNFKINGESFSFAADTTVSQMIAQVNNSKAGVNMAYSEISNSFVINSKKMGANEKVELANTGTTNAFGAGGVFGMSTTSASGSNAKIVINDQVVEKETNNFTVDGMNFTITDELAAGTQTFNITFSQDVNAVVDKVQNFVKAYNEMVNGFYDMLTEDKNSKFPPLTDEQRSAMSEKEIETWETKSKAGILKSDPTLRTLMSDLRSGIWAAVGDTGGSAFSIGISTAVRTKSGELQLDPEAFRAALEDDPERVAQIMTKMSDAADKAQKFNESGFVARISNLVGSFGTDTRNGVIKQQTQKISDFDKKIDDLTIKLYRQQERYYAQFTSLEKIMGNMNAQSQWLSSQMSSMSGS